MSALIGASFLVTGGASEIELAIVEAALRATKGPRAWLAIRPQGLDTTLFLNGTGRAMTRAGFEYIPAKHVVRGTVKLTGVGATRRLKAF